MKIFKKTLSILICFLFALSVAGCTSELTPEKQEALIAEVLENVEFQQEMTQLNEMLVGTSYDIPEGVTAEAYSAGYPADRFALFNCESSALASEVEAMLQSKTKELYDTYKSYDTSQLNKLDNAIIKTSGNTVIYCVTDDYENAEEIINNSIN